MLKLENNSNVIEKNPQNEEIHKRMIRFSVKVSQIYQEMYQREEQID
jgi:hypothetical protein